MFRMSWILGPLAVLLLGLTAGRSVAQPAGIIGPPTAAPIYTSPSPVAYVAPSTVSYYAAPAPVVVAPAVVPPVATTYYRPALLPRREVVTTYYYNLAPVVTYSSSQVVVYPRVVRSYYGGPVYVYP